MSDKKILPGRAVVSVTGADATTLLSGLVTNGPPAKDACFSALLTPQGKILFDFYISPAPDGYLFDVAADGADAFVKRLTLYRLRAKVVIGRDEAHAVYSDADDNDARTIMAIDENASVDTDYHARRIAAGVPEWGADFGSDELFPMDVNFDLIGGVDYKKGCFVGQEVASRMKRKGSARKRTLVARFDGPPPPKETPVTAGDSTLGHIMSGVDGSALALIRLDRWENALDAGDAITAGERTIELSRPPYMTVD